MSLAERAPLGAGEPVAVRHLPLVIDGQHVAAGDRATIDVVDPAQGTVVATAVVASPADLDEALAAAGRAQLQWAATDAWTRSRIVRDIGRLLEGRKDELAHLITLEQGKRLSEARGEAAYAAETFDWFADEARRVYGRTIPGHDSRARLSVLRQPIGVVAAFTPWNFPAVAPARKIAPALASGCAVILKPSEETPGPAFLIADACAEAGLPDGLVNIVTGVPSEISRHLIGSDVIRMVSLTGSVAVGRELMRLCADRITRPTLELGGHAAVLVLEDADVELAVSRCVEAKFRNAGQVCVAPSRFYIDDSLFDAFVDRFTEAVRSLRLGSGLDPATDTGPLASERRLAAVEALVADAIERGAQVMIGGKRPNGLQRGFYYEPTVLTGVTTDMRLMIDEPFGPIAPMLSFSSLEEGLRLANATPFGLAGYAFTRDLAAATQVTEGLDVGLVGINTCLTSTVEAPFGGVKLSGLGTENGAEGIEEYLTTKYAQVLL